MKRLTISANRLSREARRIGREEFPFWGRPMPAGEERDPMPARTRNRISWEPVVRQRLQSVQDSLVRFQVSPKDSQTLHDLRVACRRAEAALRLCRDLLPTQPAKWLQKRLQQLRRWSNALRDNEVLQEWLKGQGRGSFARDSLKALKSERQAERERIIGFTKDLLREDRWTDHVKRVCRAGEQGGPDRDRLHITRRWLDELFQFVLALPAETSRASELHPFRIASKRLRYAIECVCDIVSEAKFSSLKRILAQIQERLGELHDLDVRLIRLKEWDQSNSESPPWRKTTVESQRLLTAWQAWWRTTAWESTVGSAVTEILRLR